MRRVGSCQHRRLVVPGRARWGNATAPMRGLGFLPARQARPSSARADRRAPRTTEPAKDTCANAGSQPGEPPRAQARRQDGRAV